MAKRKNPAGPLVASRVPASPARRARLREIGWQPGQSGNPAGRKPGARNRFSEAFLTDFLADWTANGKKVISRVRNDDPSTYLRVAATLLPAKVDVKSSLLDDLRDADDDDLRALLVDTLKEAGIRVDARGAERLFATTDEESGTTH